MKYIDELDLQGKTVFIRSDLNVPFDEQGRVADDNRIKASVPTIKHAVDAGAKVIVASHLGRPKGTGPEPEFSLKPVAAALESALGRPVKLAPDCIGAEVQQLASCLKAGEVLLLENLRFHKGEEKNDAQFARELASLAQVYVNDAFATAHRAHASTAGVVEFIAVVAGGFTLKDELEYFRKAFANPQRPLVAVFGGAKVSTKLGAIRHTGERADVVLVGGAMANTFFAAMGHGVGKSLYEPDLLQTAKETLEWFESSRSRLVLPTDVLIAPELKSGSPTKVVPIDAIPDDMMALDIGPATIGSFSAEIQKAKTVLWNGPMGAFETAEFSGGTYAIVDALANCNALTVVGGGDTDLALHRRHAYEKMSYVSTAGGAFLCLLEGSELPAVLALERKAA